MNEFLRDPEPDPRLRHALGSLDEPPLEAVDWERLRGSIRERAALPLARRRREQQRPARRWLRPLVPAAAAAALALVIGSYVAGPTPEPAAEPIATATGFRPVVEEVLGIPLSEEELDLLFGPVSADMLVVAALAQP